MITITMNEDFTLSCDTNIIPAQYSSNIKFYFEVLQKYQDCVVIPGYFYCGCTKVESAVDNYANGEFTIPANAFSNEGVLAIAFAITTGEETVTTTFIEFEVRGSVDTSFSLPEEITWQSMLQNFMDQYMEKVYSKIIEDLIAEASTLQTNTEKLQTTVNGLIRTVNELVTRVTDKLDNGDFTLDFKWEGTKLFIKKHTDSSWGIGVDLRGSTTIELDNAILTNVILSTTRTASPTSMAKVQLKGADGKVIWVETSAEQVFLKSTDGTSEISQKALNEKIGELINLVAFYDSSPVSALNELKKYIPTIK